MPTMNVSLTKEFAEFVEREVAGGNYASASEVVRDALRILKYDRESEAVKLHLLRQEIARGIDDVRSGNFSDKSVDEIFDEAIRSAGG